MLQRGNALVAAKRYLDAAVVYRLAVQADPRNGEARVKLADALWSAQDWNEGALEAIRAADLLPGHMDVQLLAASRALAIGRFSEVPARVSPILREEPNNVEALIVLGNATARLRHSTGALDFLRTKARTVKTFEGALRDVRPLTSPADDRKAEQIFRDAMKLKPGADEPRLAFVNFLWAAGRPDEAADLLRQLADQHPGHLLLNHALAEYYLARGNKPDGEAYLKSAAAGGDVDVRLELAEFYTSAGRDSDALAVLDSFKENHPPDLVSLSLLRARIECRRGQHDTALPRIDHVLARNPHDGQALELKAECLLGAARTTEALRSARAAVAATPTSAAAHFVLGQAMSADGFLEDAFAEFADAVRLDPLYRPASRAFARHALDMGRPEIAAALGWQLVEADPSDEDAAVTLVTGLVRRRDYVNASAALRPLLLRFPTSARLLVQQGDLYVADGTSGARRSYELALALDRDSLEAFAGLVSLDLAEKHTAVAKERIERALTRDPNRGGYLLLLGRVLDAEGDVARSEAIFRRLIAIHSGEEIPASLALSMLLTNERREEDARTVLEQLLTRRPSALDARIALATLLEDTGRMADAEAQYKKVLADNPRSGVAAYKLASLQADQGRNLDIALDLAATAVQVMPNDPSANDALGWIHVRKHLPRVGLPHLESSVRAAPENPTYRYHLGMAYVAIGDREKGRIELLRALALNPDFRLAREARAALNAASP